MKKHLLTLGLLISFSGLYARGGATPASIADAIVSGRVAVATAVSRGDTAMLRSLRDKLCEQAAPTPYLAFSRAEYLLTLFWTRQYDPLLDYALHFDGPQWRYFAEKTQPAEDELPATLFKYSTTGESMTRLRQGIRENATGVEQADFLEILLDWLAYDMEDRQLQSQLTRAESYQTRYPASPYNRFLGYFFKGAVQTSDWSYGVSAGPGVSTALGQFSNVCGPGINVNISFETFYKDLFLGLGWRFGWQKNNGPLRYEDEYFWGYYHEIKAEDYKLRESLLDFRAGWRAVNNRSIALVPYLNCGRSGLMFAGVGNHTPGAGSDQSFSYGGGIICDFKLRKSILKDTDGAKESYTAVRLRYSMNRSDHYKEYAGPKTIIQVLSVEFALHESIIRKRRNW